MKFNIIACVDENNGLGTPYSTWIFKKDLDFFKNMTENNVVIMGNNTYKTLKGKLSNRINIVLTKEKYKDVLCFDNMLSLLLFIFNNKYDNVFIIGGSITYIQFLELKIVKNIYLTKINNTVYKCDQIFNINNYKKEFVLESEQNKFDIDEIHNSNKVLTFYKYKYFNKEENKFLKTVNKIITKGSYTLDRSNVGTLSIFGKSFTYNIKNYRLPLFTHRKVFLRGIIEELLFFISGKTNTKILEEKNINIWKEHTSREFLDMNKLNNYEEGSYGPSYGFQLRHWNAEFIDDNTDYTGKGFDQLEYLINEIKNNPTSRRLVFSYWNPSVLDKVPLPSCHILYNFNIDMNTKELSCSFYQRSNDFCLSAVFNIVSASVLVFMICHLTGYIPGKIIHNIGNIHIYMNQLNVAQELINNEPNNFPLLLINDENNEIKKIDDFKYNHFKLLFYNSHKKYNIPFAR